MSDTGGQAFPRPFSQHDDRNHMGYDFNEQPGMTLRDWFAGQALAGILSNPEFDADATKEDVASAVYQTAAAMLRERDK